jgi:hypothetical protein
MANFGWMDLNAQPRSAGIFCVATHLSAPSRHRTKPSDSSRKLGALRLSTVYLSEGINARIERLAALIAIERTALKYMAKKHLPVGLDHRTRDQNPPKAGQIW